MRKISILLTMLVLAAMVLAACGGEETATDLPSTQVPQTTVDATEAMTEPATEAPTDAATEVATGTPGVPVTGELNPARLSNQLDFTVWSQDGEQIGEVDDMVLDLDNTRVAYVVVGTGGFLDLGEREILVPWDSLQLQTGTGQGTGTGQATEPAATSGAGTGTDQATATPGTGGAVTGQETATAGTGGTGTGQETATAGTGTGDTTGGQQNAFILQGDVEMFRNAPDFDLNNLPQMGEPAGDWDADIRTYWEGGGTGTGQATEPAATSGAGTGTDQATATSGTGGTGTGQETATAGTDTGQATATAGTGTGQGEGTAALQGVVLATEILGSTVNLSAEGTGTGTDQATEPAATSGAGTGQATATAGTGGTGTGQETATADTGTGGTGTDQGPTTATIEDMIVDTDAGDILYIVLNAAFTDAERWIPVPLGMFQWNAGTQGFVFSGDPTMLQGAPFFEDGQFPDTTTSGWNSEFDTFWQNSGAGGTGTGSGSGGAEATATP